MLPIRQTYAELGDVLQKQVAHGLRNEAFVHFAEAVAHRRNSRPHGGDARAGVDDLEYYQVRHVSLRGRRQVLALELRSAVRTVGLLEGLPDAHARVERRKCRAPARGRRSRAGEGDT